MFDFIRNTLSSFELHIAYFSDSSLLMSFPRNRAVEISYSRYTSDCVCSNLKSMKFGNRYL